MRIAAGIAVQTGAVLELLHVNTSVLYAVPFPGYDGGEYYNLGRYDENAVRELREAKLGLLKMPVFAGLHIETRLEEGALYNAVRRIVTEDKVGLVVMGTKGATGLNEFLVGSNTEKVIRTAPCPVLAVPQQSGEFIPRRAVLTTTLQPGQSSAFAELAAWQQFFPMEIKVLYLNNPAELLEDDKIEATVRTLAEQAGLQNVSAVRHEITFEEEETLLDYAKKEKADLIAMTTYQRRGLSHLLFGSLTEDTANHSTIPVLAIPDTP